MSSLKQITQDIIADINKTLELASDACNGSPLQHVTAVHYRNMMQTDFRNP